MTHYHFSTLGQCLISLAKQGITSPLKRVLRFIEAGAVVPLPTDLDTLPTIDCKESLNKSLSCSQHQKAKTPSCVPKKSTILSGVIKADFSRAKALLDQIKLISTSSYAQNPPSKIAEEQKLKSQSSQTSMSDNSEPDVPTPLSHCQDQPELPNIQQKDDSPSKAIEDQELKSQSSWTSISDDSEPDVPTSLTHCQDQPELPNHQQKDDCTITLEDIQLPKTEIHTINQEQNHDNQQTEDSTEADWLAVKNAIPEDQGYENFMRIMTAFEKEKARRARAQQDIQLLQVEETSQKESQQQQIYEENQQLQTEQLQQIEQNQDKMANSSLNGKLLPQKDITELAKKLEQAAAANETFQNDLSHLIENIFMDKSKRRTIKTPVTNETNLFQLRYATSFQYQPCDLYNLSIGFVTMKGRKQMTTVDDTFLRKHTVGELFENSELTHATTEICDLFQMATMEELMDYFNEKVLKRERFSKGMYAAVEEIAKSVLEEIESEEQYQQY